MKNILITILIPLSVFVYGQSNKSVKLYNEGLKMFQEKQFIKADSLFTLSNNLYPHVDTYYNLALTKFQLNDTCGFCQNMNIAIKYNDLDAGAMFYKLCVRHDTIKFGELKNDTLLFSVVSTGICTKERIQRFYIKDYKNQKITAFYFVQDLNSNQTQKLVTTVFPKFNSADKIYSYNISDLADQMPEFPGGQKILRMFLSLNLTYPRAATDYGIQGDVIVEFQIDETGQVKSPQVIKGIGGGCDEECLRVINLMPKWKPAMNNGVPISVRYQMTIKYTLM